MVRQHPRHHQDAGLTRARHPGTPTPTPTHTHTRTPHHTLDTVQPMMLPMPLLRRPRANNRMKMKNNVAGHPMHVGVAHALQRDVVFALQCCCVLCIGGALRGWVSCHMARCTPSQGPESPASPGHGCFCGCFFVIEAHGGTWFQTPCPVVVRSRSKC